jgi:Mrp family chromosome partitioning ATPase
MATALVRAGQADQARVAALAERCSSILEKLRDGAQSRRASERREPTFTIGRAADLVGRTPAAIREAEKDGRLPEPGRTDTNRRVGYTLAQVNDMRGVFGTRPWRDAADPCAIVAVQNFKGGVGKSTLSVHLAQYLAMRGYRVLLIDCDSQASASTLFGYVPDLDLDEEQTLYPFLRQDELTSLDYAIRSTHFDGLDLIPANLRLFQSEYELAARMARGQGALLDRLQHGIASVADRYDVVVIDPPPALGAISLSVLRAANALIVPGDARRDDERPPGTWHGDGAQLPEVRGVQGRREQVDAARTARPHEPALRPRARSDTAQGLGRDRQCVGAADDRLRARRADHEQVGARSMPELPRRRELRDRGRYPRDVAEPCRAASA